MKSITYFSLFYSFIACSLFTTISFAEEIDFSDEATAKKLLLNKMLHCQMDEQNYHGPELIKVIKI